MNDIDITLAAGGGYFIHRVGAVIIQDNKLLMIKNENFPYFYSVGGRVKFGETSESAVLREVYEETQVRMDIARLAFVHENFFTVDFLNHAPGHEISLFYLMNQTDGIEHMKSGSAGADGGRESLHWLPLDDLSEYHLFPEFFKTELKNIDSGGVEHFISKDGNTFRAK